MIASIVMRHPTDSLSSMTAMHQAFACPSPLLRLCIRPKRHDELCLVSATANAPSRDATGSASDLCTPREELEAPPVSIRVSRCLPPVPHPSALIAMKEAYLSSNAAPYAGACAHFLSLQAATLLEESRRDIAKYFNLLPLDGNTEAVLPSRGKRLKAADSKAEEYASLACVPAPLAFCSNLDVAWNLFARSLRARHVVVAVSVGDTAAGAFANAGSEVSILQSLGLEPTVPLLRRDTDAIVLPLACKVTGEVNIRGIQDILEFVRASGADTKIVLDVSVACGHYPIDVLGLGVDFIVGDGINVRAPTPIGFFGGQTGVMETLIPPLGGDGVQWEVSLGESARIFSEATTYAKSAIPSDGIGDFSDVVARESLQPVRRAKQRPKSKAAARRQKRASKNAPQISPKAWAPIPARFEPGMPSIAAVAGMAAAMKVVFARDGGRDSEPPVRLGEMLTALLASISGVHVLSGSGLGLGAGVNCSDDSYERTGTVSFFTEGEVSSIGDVADALSRQGVVVEVRTCDLSVVATGPLKTSSFACVTLFPGFHTESDVRIVYTSVKDVVGSQRHP